MTENSTQFGGSLPWPEQWSVRPSGRVIVLTVLMALITLFLLGMGIVAAIDGDPRGAFMLFGCLVTGLITVSSAKNARSFRKRPIDGVVFGRSADSSDVAVSVPYSSFAYAVYWAFPVVLLIVFGVGTVVAGLGLFYAEKIDFSVAAPFAVALIFSVYLVWSLVELGSGRFGKGYIELSTQGIRHRSWAFSATVPWDSCRFVVPFDDHRNGPIITVDVGNDRRVQFKRTTRLWKQPELSVAPSLSVHGRYLGVDPTVLLYALRYYIDHPEARPELGREAGAHRIRTGNLLT